jgi:prepilin-type N-terminal cleavage/methylation domain-containing protein
MPIPSPRSTAGFTLIEVLAALLILTLVILTSLTVFGDRARRVRDAGEMSLAWQGLANEAEARRRQPFDALEPGGTSAFLTDPSAEGALEEAAGEVSIDEEAPGVRTLVLRIEWRGGTKRAETTVYRTATGGGALW